MLSASYEQCTFEGTKTRVRVFLARYRTLTAKSVDAR